MKNNLLSLDRRFFAARVAAACAATVATAAAQAPGQAAPAKAAVMRDAATHTQLAQGLRMAQQADPMRNMKATEGVDPSVVNRPPSILENSDIVCFNGEATLIPKRAILLVPRNIADRLKMKTGARFRSWTEFYSMNRGWITTVEVSRLQAEGNEAISPESRKQIDQMTKVGNLIIATYQGGPISVLPLKVPETPPAGAANASATTPAVTAKQP